MPFYATLDAIGLGGDARRGGRRRGHAVEVCIEHVSGTDKAFLYTSGAWVLGDTGGAIVDESSALSPPELVSHRVALERRLLEAPGMRRIVLRPGIVYGHGAGIPAMFVASARARHGALRRRLRNGPPTASRARRFSAFRW